MPTLTVYPDADPESTSVDGTVSETNGNTWFAIRNGTGTVHNDTNSIAQSIRLHSESTTDDWQEMQRGIFLFDTSDLGSGISINSATFSLYGSYKLNGLFLSDSDGALCLVSSDPVSNTSIAGGDYDSIGITEFATRIGFSNLNDSGYNDMPLNNAGKTFIDKTGITKFGTRLGCDLDSNEPTWVGNDSTLLESYFAEWLGTANDPKLTITYSGSTQVSDERDANIVGKFLEDSDERDAVVFGYKKAQDERDASIYGGPNTASSSRNASIAGTGTGTTETDERNAEVTGKEEESSERNASIYGRNAGTTETDERNASIHGRDTASSSRDASIFGIISTIATSERAAVIDGKGGNIGDYILPNRPIQILLGFEGETLMSFDGYSERPVSKQDSKTTKIKAFDRIDKINGYRLPEGNLKTDITVSEYIKGILQEMDYTPDDYDLDGGLQTIPLLYYEGNNAGYEIKTACEAVGGKFYQREDGKLVYENRQHYQNPEHKESVWSFNYDNLYNLKYEYNKSGIINKVVVKLNPRKQQSQTTIWQYGETPSISPGEVRTIWTSFDDPVEPLTMPVANTDYTGNSLEDGSGTDRTSDISITTTEFAKAAKLEIENTGTNNLYLTKMELRGQPYKKQGETVITAEDASSINNYGEKKMTIKNKYMTDEDFAQTLADYIINVHASPKQYMEFETPAIPQLQLGDMIGIRNDEQNADYLMRITRIKTIFDEGGMRQRITCREVTDIELADYFTIGTSEIAGDDIISP